MVRRFRPKPRGSKGKRVYGQRWQTESGFSRLKRRLGSTVSAVRCIVYNLTLLAGP
jgi:IS4 transposase